MTDHGQGTKKLGLTDPADPAVQDAGCTVMHTYRWHPLLRLAAVALAIAAFVIGVPGLPEKPFAQEHWTGHAIPILFSLHLAVAVARVRLSVSERGDIECIRALWPYATRTLHHLEIRGRIWLRGWDLRSGTLGSDSWWIVSAMGPRVPVDRLLHTDAWFRTWFDALTLLDPPKQRDADGSG